MNLIELFQMRENRFLLVEYKPKQTKKKKKTKNPYYLV